MFTLNKDGTYTDLSNGQTISKSEYKLREPLHKIVNSKNGFVGSSTRQNIVSKKTVQHFPHTGSKHTTYSFHPSQSSLINKSIESLSSRHPTNNGFFVRLHLTSPDGDDFYIQTSSYDNVEMLMEELSEIITKLSAYYGVTSIDKISFVVRS